MITTSEHKLTQAEQEYFKANQDKLQKLEVNYYALVGKAKEMHDELLVTKNAVDQQLTVIVKNAGLTAGRIRIAPDSSCLIIEQESETPVN